MGLAYLRTLFFGLAARRAALDYVLVTLLIMFILLAIAWAIDLAKEMNAIRDTARDTDQSVLEILLPYLLYRGVDICTRLLPVACFFGVFLAEIMRRFRLDTVILAAAGASPLRLLGPVAIFGVLMGAGLYKLHADWRPAAVEAQVALGQGGYYHRFRPKWMGFKHWFVYGDTVVQGEVYRTPTPAMRDVLIFTGLQNEALSVVYGAETLQPSDQGPGMWDLKGVTRWGEAQPNTPGQAVPDLTIALPMTFEELRFFKIEGHYLRRAPLLKLRASYPGSEAQIFASVTLWQRSIIWLLPFALAALAVTFARAGFLGRVASIPRLIALGTTGYICVVSVKVVYAIGEIAGLSPAAATAGPILALLLLAAALTARDS